MKFILLFAFAIPNLLGNVCTPLAAPATGQFPAIVNGIDNLSYNSVRILWTADVSGGTPGTAQRIQYSTNAEWAISPGVYQHTAAIWNSDPSNSKGTLTNAQVFNGGNVTALVGSTGYHATGQTYEGIYPSGAWCPAVDITFTTLAQPATPVQPTLPATLDTTRPTVTGTDYAYGSACGASGTATVRWNDCLSKVNPDLGDGIAAPGGVYQFTGALNFPNRPSAVSVTCATGTNLCTQSGTPPTSGQQAIFYEPPSPVNPGVPYKIINVSTSAGPGSTGPFVTSGALSSLRNDFTGYVGFSFTPATNFTINQLGRWVVSGNSQTHILKLTDAATGTDLPGGSVTVNTSGATTGAYLYGTLGTPVTLHSGHQYYMTSQETNGGDQFYDLGTVTPTAGTATLNSGAFNNGSWGTLGTSNQSYGPVNFNVSALGTITTFNISYDGSTVITFLNIGGDSGGTAGSPIYYLTYPLSSSKVLIHSTAASNLLPPDGVRVGPDTIAQYRPNMIEFEDMDPTIGLFNWGPIAGGYYFQDVVVSFDPSVGTASSPNGLDPIGYRSPLTIGSSATNHNIIFNQSYFDFAPVGGPSRSYLIGVAGLQEGFTNSTLAGLNWWQPFLTNTTGASFTSSSVTINPFTLYWVGSDGTSATKQSCTSTTGTVTITSGGGITTGPNARSMVLSVKPDCTMALIVQTGMTVTTSANISVTTTAAPFYPQTYTYTGPSGGTATGQLYLDIGDGELTAGSLTAFNMHSPIGETQDAGEAGGGFYATSNVRTTFKWDNNYISGANIVGFFLSDDITDETTPCGIVSPCPLAFNPGDLTESRSTITVNPCFNPDATCWNGGNYFGRNFSETKQGARVLQDGNQYGPFFPMLGQGQCTLHETYVGMDNNGGPNYGVYTGFPFYGDSSNWTFTNNTCSQTGTGIATNITTNWGGGRVNQNLKIQNNLFLNINGYAQASTLQPYNIFARVFKDPSSSDCANGYTASLGSGGQNYIFDHNTISGSGGCLPLFYDVTGSLPSTVTITNNILNLVNDPGAFSSYTLEGSFYHGYNNGDFCLATAGKNFLACIGSLTWAGNVMLATWSNSLPGSQVEFASSDITGTLEGYYTGFPTNWPAANTLALRQTQTGWSSVATNNFQLTSTSPYISGNTHSATSPTTDGLDAGMDQNQRDVHQGRVSNVRAYGLASTSATIAWFAPDSFPCGVDWSTNSFATWTRVAGSAGSPDARVQSIALSGLPAHGSITARVNCQVAQPTLQISLP
jgi:hypothetical protein